MPTMSQLDAAQVIKLSADEVNGAIKVNVVATAASAASEVKITSGDGSGNDALVTVGKALVVDGSASIQPVSAASLPLPTGASTSANQTSELTKLDTLHTDLVAVEGKQDTGNTSLASVDSKLGTLGQKLSAGSAPVVLASDQSAIPASQSGTWNVTNVSGTVSLPTGASTSANQTSSLTKLDTLHTDLGTIEGKQDSGNISLASIDGKITTTANGIKVDGSATTQPISGTVTVVQGTGTNLHTVVDSGTVAATQSGTWNVTNVSGTVSLPTGASTEATLAKLTLAQGATTSGETGPLVQGAVTTAAPTYTTAQTSPLSLTTSGALRTDSSASTQPISGTVAATQSGTWTVQPGNTANTTPWLATINQGGNSAAVSASNALKVDGSASTQPVSGTITANVGTTGGLALDASLSTIDTDIKASQPRKLQDGSGNAITSTGSALDVNLKTSSITLNTSAAQSGTWNITNVSGTVSLPTGAATSAKQPALGTAGSASADVISVQGIASMTALKVDGSGVTQPVSGTVSAAQSGTWSTRTQDGAGTAITSATVGAHQGIHTSTLGFTLSEFARNDYSSGNVTTAAYTQLVASTSNEYQEVEIFDSSGQTLQLAVGAALSEVNKFLIFPGGNGRIKYRIASGSRISIKAVSATANTGEISINFYG